ncbi:MAG: isochorismatase family cysteine hydrolase [Planctomycetota bacterium]|nr:isochorismatase family cysteine hydrolase [Planctomycetota bacterium]
MPGVPRALLIVDMQNDFVLPGAPACIAGAEATLPKIKQALDFWHKQSWPVVYLYREYRRDGSDIERSRLESFLQDKKFCLPGSEGAKIVASIAPQPSDYQVMKNRFSGFMETELDFILRREGIGAIAVCGTQFPCCVRATLVDGLCYGYDTLCLTDATSAASPDVAQANIRDLENMGIACPSVDAFISAR